MITHKEAIERLKNVTKNQLVGIPLNQEEIIELLESEIWHNYPDEKPKENKSYLIKYESGEYRVLEYINNNWEELNDCYKDKIVAWRELPKYEKEIK